MKVIILDEINQIVAWKVRRQLKRLHKCCGIPNAVKPDHSANTPSNAFNSGIYGSSIVQERKGVLINTSERAQKSLQAG
jgi:hypothetical protein